MKTWTCAVCTNPIPPEADGTIRLEGVTTAGDVKTWIWGPVPVHDECRVLVRTPYDTSIGNGEFLPTWQRVPA